MVLGVKKCIGISLLIEGNIHFSKTINSRVSYFLIVYFAWWQHLVTPLIEAGLI